MTYVLERDLGRGGAAGPLLHAADARRDITEGGKLFSSLASLASAASAMELTIPGCAADPPKRVCSKMVHLTYAALYDGEITFDTLLQGSRFNVQHMSRRPELTLFQEVLGRTNTCFRRC